LKKNYVLYSLGTRKENMATNTTHQDELPNLLQILDIFDAMMSYGVSAPRTLVPTQPTTTQMANARPNFPRQRFACVENNEEESTTQKNETKRRNLSPSFSFKTILFS